MSGSTWVGDWGRCSRCDRLSDISEELCHACVAVLDDPRYCPGCGGLSKQAADEEFCARHEAMLNEIAFHPVMPEQSEALRVAALATLRPSAVVARPQGDQTNAPDDIAVLWVPAGASRKAWLAAQAVATITTRRLKEDWSLKWALRVAAIGRDQVVDELGKLGIAMDRKTAAAGLLELQELGAIEKVGQLPSWTDPKEPDASRVNKSGSFIYTLEVVIRSLGERALEGLISYMQLFGGMRGDRRARRCLKWAIANAQPGFRNAIGYWLGRRCLDSGLTLAEATSVITEFSQSVDQSCHRYTPRETMATLRSAYRRHGGAGVPARRVTASETF